MNNKVKRYSVIDFIRGLTLISMIFYHGVWDLYYIYGFKWSAYKGLAGEIWQKSICITFILLSGFCFRLGSRHLKRGLLIFGGGIAVTAVTLLFMRENRIIFGILTFLGTAQLITIPFEKPLKKISPLLGLVISIALFTIFYNVNSGYIGVGELAFKLPGVLYGSLFGTFVGFTEKGFFSTDYFSVLPWLFIYFSGFYIFDIVGGRNTLKKMPHINIPPVNFIGRHSLLVYLLHQPVVYGLLWVLMKGVG